MNKIYYFLLITNFLFISCSVQKIDFETPVDTRTKKINIQKKQVFNIDDFQVYASNKFDGARLNGFSKKNDSTLVAHISPENTPINNSPYYAFSTWSDIPQTVYITFDYPVGYKHRYIPKIKKNNIWSTIDSTNIFTQDSIYTIKLNLEKDPTVVAAQEIQSSANVKDWYTNLSQIHSNKIAIISAGKTKLKNNLPVLDISLGSKQNKPTIVILTRQHPPEVTGYYAFQEFIKTIVSDSNLSNEFLKKYNVIAFPIMNPDGVDMGHWRHNAGGVDTNRDWSKYRQPEIRNAVKYIAKQLKTNKSELILGLDFHSTWYDVFYTNKDQSSVKMPNFNSEWFSKMEQNIVNYKVNEESANSTKPVSKGWFLKAHNSVGITYEIGDKTEKVEIQTIGRVSAEEMMLILLNKNLSN